MYTPAPFRISDAHELRQFMAAHPLATVITCTDNGPDAAHLPLLWHDDGSEHGVLHGHFAKANPLWRNAHTSPHSPWLAIFQHPGHYISPNYYPSKARDHKAVPTWNYQAVHAHGRLRLIDDPEAVLAMLTALTAAHEHSQPRPWQLADAPQDWLIGLTRAIVCFELVIERLEGKYKLNQHHSADNRHGAIASLRQQGTPQSKHMADIMQKTLENN